MNDMSIKDVLQKSDKRLHALCMITLGGLLAANAQAASLDFNVAAPTPAVGSIIYNPAVDPALIGNAIEVDTVAGLDTLSHNGVVSTCSSCLLSFNTGAFTGYDAGTQTWSFSGGGTINIIGGVDFPDLAAPDDIPAGTTLLTGTFNNAMVVQLSSGAFDFRIAGGAFTDTKDVQLLSYYSLPQAALYQGGFNLSFQADALADNGFSSTAVVSGNILNSPVPLPSALLLLLSALSVFPVLSRFKGSRPRSLAFA